MFLAKKILNISLVLLIFSIGIAPISAANKKKAKSKKTRLAKKTSNLVQSSDSTTVTEGGKTTLLDIKSAEKKAPTPLNDKASSNQTTSAIPSKGTSSQEKEIEILSEKLGIAIPDASLLSLYREVGNWLGTRYRRGGMSRKGVDCSGFTNIIYNSVFDKKIERVSYDIAKSVKESLPISELLPGDLVFFATNRRKKSINHVGVYLGNGYFAHASCKYGVIVSSLAEGYYNRVWKKGGRLD